MISFTAPSSAMRSSRSNLVILIVISQGGTKLARGPLLAAKISPGRPILEGGPKFSLQIALGRISAPLARGLLQRSRSAGLLTSFKPAPEKVSNLPSSGHTLTSFKPARKSATYLQWLPKVEKYTFIGVIQIIKEVKISYVCLLSYTGTAIFNYIAASFTPQ